MPALALLLLASVTCGCVWYLLYSQHLKQKASPPPPKANPPPPKPPPDTRLLVDAKLSEGMVGFRVTENGQPMYLSGFDVTPAVARCTAYRLLLAADSVDRKRSRMLVDDVEQHYTAERQ